MTDRNSPPLPSPGATQRRRSSFSQGFTDFFRQSSSGQGAQANSTPTAYPGPITSAAAQAQRRRLSLTTIGLSGSPNQTSPFNTTKDAFPPRRESISSMNSSSVDESPFEEDNTPGSSVPTTPFARRLSFGARALAERSSQGNANGRASKSSIDKATFSPLNSKGRNSPTAKSREGFNFAESFRNRAERASISGPPHMPSASIHQRAKSAATVEPAREMPKQPRRPDAFQERILKGDFYMD